MTRTAFLFFVSFVTSVSFAHAPKRIHKRAPQFLQNFASGSFGTAHCAQARVAGAVAAL